jgi:SAM-dependent methyltransferase
MNWKTKAAIQRALAKLPANRYVYYLGQRLAGGLHGYRADRKVQQGLNLLAALAQSGETISGKQTVELGTGWVPVLPLLFWLYGQEHCASYDVTRLLRYSLVEAAAKQLVAMISDEQSSLGRQREIDWIASRATRLADLVQRKATGKEILQVCQIDYQAPADTARTALADESTDIVFSNTVLEHVPRDEISRIFREAYRILRPGGYMLHQVDPSDHFAHGDRSISAVNFLQFSQTEFSKYNTAFLYQNRLRAPTYRQLVPAAHFEVVCWESDLNEKALSHISRLSIHGEFAGFSAEELCTTGIRMVAKRH